METDVYGDTFTEEDVLEEYTQTLADLAKSVASRVSRKWGIPSDRDDIWSEIMMWVVDHTDTLDRWRAEESSDAFNAYVVKTFNHVAKDYASRMKMQRMGYPEDVLSWYSLGELKGLLEHVFTEESWIEPPAKSQEFSAKGDPSTGGNWIATLADVAQAINRLPEHHRETIISHYALGVTVTAQAEESARRALHEVLGGDEPDRSVISGGLGSEPVGSRKVLSNAQARAVTNKQMGYEE